MIPPALAPAALSAAILAGGKATRLGGRNKAFLEIDGEPLICRSLATLRRLVGDIMVVAVDPIPYRQLGARVVVDDMPGCGALGGLHAALAAASTPHVFVCACDMPYIDADLIGIIAARIGDADAAIPQDAFGWQPLHAIYARRILPVLTNALNAGTRGIQDFLAGLTTVTIPVTGSRAFVNINTPADLADAARFAQRPPS